MIIAHHFSVHGGFDFPITSITFNRLWYQFILMGGSLGNNIFVLISGYFLVKSKGLNYIRLINLWLRMIFYSVIIYAVFAYFGSVHIELKALIKVVSGFNLWFADIYIIMYLLHPYINILINAMSCGDYRKFLTSIFIYWSIIPMFTGGSFGGNALIHFVCLYSLAGYVRLWCDDYGSKKFILIGACFIALNYISIIVFDIIGLQVNLFARNATYMTGMMRPLTICATLCLLIGFKHLNIKHSKIINTLAAATFGVYLIHDNGFIRPFLWHEVFRNASYQNSPYLIPYSIAVIVIVYVSCTVIEILRSKIFRVLSRGKLS